FYRVLHRIVILVGLSSDASGIYDQIAVRRLICARQMRVPADHQAVLVRAELSPYRFINAEGDCVGRDILEEIFMIAPGRSVAQGCPRVVPGSAVDRIKSG